MIVCIDSRYSNSGIDMVLKLSIKIYIQCVGSLNWNSNSMNFWIDITRLRYHCMNGCVSDYVVYGYKNKCAFIGQ